jgi:signal transduction histidine kinase
MIRSGVFGEVSEQQQNAASEIIDSVNQLVAFVNNLIGQAQLETGKLVLKERLFESDELFEAARTTASMLAKKKGLAIECTVADGFPARLKGDPYWLRQIVLNLVNNAVKFTESGSVRVHLYQPNPENWAIRVSDTGIGIPPEAQETIFDPFRQVDGTVTRKYSGSGLGLAIVKELTDLMGGRVYLNSVVGKGTEFTVVLPLLQEES